MPSRLWLVLLLLTSFTLIGCASRPPEDNKLKLGVIPLIINLPVYVAQQEGLFEAENINVETVPFTSTVAQSSAFLSGQVDGILQHIYATAILNKDRETGKLIGASVMPVFNVIAAEGSGIASVTELTGKEIAVATSTVIDYALERLLLTEGLNTANIVKVNVPDMALRLEMLNQKIVPVAILSSPLSDLAILNGGRVIVNDSRQPFAGPGLVFTRKALESKSETIARFTKVWQQAVELINDNPERYQDLLNEIARVPQELSKDLRVPVFPRLELPAESEVKSYLDWLRDKGIISKPLSYDEIVDTKYLR